jgi:sialate O-acetylesterase
MEFSVHEMADGQKEIDEADYPGIRLLKIKREISKTPKEDIIRVKWQKCSPQTVPSFSAVFYLLGKHIHLDKKIPVGLIETVWSGTYIESWISRDSIITLPEYATLTDKLIAKMPDDIDTTWFWRLDQKWYVANSSNLGLDLGVHQPDYQDVSWPDIVIPGIIDTTKDFRFEGASWFRKTIELPASARGKKLTVHLGRINEIDKLYFNGQEIGNYDWNHFLKPRIYVIPGELVKQGKNVITERVGNIWGKLGFYGPADSMFVTDGKAFKADLSGVWKYNKDIEPYIKDAIYYQDNPTVIYNAMIAPLIPFAIKGFAWYQGESNVDKPGLYKRLFSMLINDWRSRWGQGDVPFVYVQLPNYGDDIGWAYLREAQLMTLKLPNTGMAVTIDAGDLNDVHPKNKQPVGWRLYEAARHVAYNEANVYSGPLLKTVSRESSSLRLSFSSTGSGIILKDMAMSSGFEVAGRDTVYYQAQAWLSGECITVSSDKVSEPVYVRYAWAANPECTLYNKEGFPASPFRTDSENSGN